MSTCRNCTAAFPAGRIKLYCSVRCANAYRYLLRRAKSLRPVGQSRSCASCGNQFTIEWRTGTLPTYCSERCRRRGSNAKWAKKNVLPLRLKSRERNRANPDQHHAATVRWRENNDGAYRAGLRRYPERINARKAVAYAVQIGRLPGVTETACVDCGAPARQYDHYLGYAREHRLHVQAVCRACHGRRDVVRGEHVKVAA